MRIVPLPILAKLIPSFFRGVIGTFSFSCVGETAYGLKHFMQRKVLNLFHMPRVPIEPGLGIFFNQFQGKLNLIFSYLDGVLTEQEADEVINNLTSSFQACYEKAL